MIKANRVVWRGTTFDSQLESDWAATLTMWGMEYRYHPGRVFLSGGDVWEPDFQVAGDERDTVLEVKGWGNERIDKPRRAAVEAGLDVIVGRSGYIPPGSDVESAGAVWEPSDRVVARVRGALVWCRGLDADVGAAWSAEVAYRTGVAGIRMFKAVGADGIV